MDNTTKSASQELATAIAAAKAAGAIIADAFSKDIVASTKIVNCEFEGLVTQADLASEKAIIDNIKTAFPCHAFLTEESYEDDSNSEHLWVIDPLDGTNNFAHGIPHFAVSIAYYQAGEARCGAVFNPITAELFTAEQGKGAFRNGERVHVNQHSKLDETLLATGFYYDRGKMMEATLAAIASLFHQKIHGIRRFGAATLDMVDVGMGRYGGFFEFTLSPWDFAAAKLFVEEAGGRVTNCYGEELVLSKSSLLASNGSLHDLILQVIRPHLKSIS